MDFKNLFKIEEHTNPVRTLYVNAYKNYPERLEFVYKAFWKYGEIKKISLHPSRVYFFITFVNADSAKRVLAKVSYFWKWYKYNIQKADEWHQPLVLKDGTVIWERGENGIEFESQKIDPKKPSLMDINNDCLLNILERLTLTELIKIELVNKRMRSLSWTIWTHNTRLKFPESFPYKRELELNGFRQILMRCGTNLSYLDASKLYYLDEKRVIALIGKHCTNLTTLTLPQCHIRFDPTPLLGNILEGLTSLNISCSDLGSDKITKLIEGCKELNEFYNNSRIRWALSSIQPVHVHAFSANTLRVLHMNTLTVDLSMVFDQQPFLEDLLCLEIHPIQTEFKNKNRLKRLVIEGQKLNSLQILETILPNLTDLEKFSMQTVFGSISLWENFNVNLAPLTKLKELHMNHWPITGEDLLTIGRTTCNQLEIVSFHACDLITESDIISFVNLQINLLTLKLTQMHGLFALSRLDLEDYVQRRPENKVLHLIVDDTEIVEESAFFTFTKEGRGDSLCFYCQQMAQDEVIQLSFRRNLFGFMRIDRNIIDFNVDNDATDDEVEEDFDFDDDDDDDDDYDYEDFVDEFLYDDFHGDFHDF